MHDMIRGIANSAGYLESDGSLVILSCGAEDTSAILGALGGDHPVDTLISVLSLCTIPAPERTLVHLVRDILKPRGQFLFYEHVLSPRKDVAWWQSFWTPLNKLVLDGCRMDRPSHIWVEQMTVAGGDGARISMWNEGERWGQPGEPDESLFWHQIGRFVKRS